jgi:hypothetical protein
MYSEAIHWLTCKETVMARQARVGFPATFSHRSARQIRRAEERRGDVEEVTVKLWGATVTGLRKKRKKK